MWKIVCNDKKKLFKLKISEKLDLEELSAILKTLYVDNKLKSIPG